MLGATVGKVLWRHTGAAPHGRQTDLALAIVECSTGDRLYSDALI